MKFVIVFAALFALACAAPPQYAEIKSQESDVGPESFKYHFETSDGTRAEAQGQLYDIGSEAELLKVSGSFAFVADDGKTYTVNYIADENGFQPQGEHLPKAE